MFCIQSVISPITVCILFFISGDMSYHVFLFCPPLMDRQKRMYYILYMYSKCHPLSLSLMTLFYLSFLLKEVLFSTWLNSILRSSSACPILTHNVSVFGLCRNVKGTAARFVIRNLKMCYCECKTFSRYKNKLSCLQLNNSKYPRPEKLKAFL